MTFAPQGSEGWYYRPSEFLEDIRTSKWVSRKLPDYGNRKQLTPKPNKVVANVEFSFSNLKYLLDCGYQFKLRVLYGFNGPLAEPLGYGKSLHDALAEVHDRAMQGEQVKADLAPELVARHLRLPFAPPNLKELLEAKAIQEIKQYIVKNSKIFKHVVFSEQPVEINLGDGIAIKGRVDLVRRTDTGTTTIVDMKSSERSQDEDVTQTQLHAYALGYRELTGEDADFVETYELERGRRNAKRVSDSLIGDIRAKTQEGATALRSMQLHPDPHKQKCKRCDFSMLCSASMA
jgi:DNA helicase-2/ATP-dependent DNA helicase PcrA